MNFPKLLQRASLFALLAGLAAAPLATRAGAPTSGLALPGQSAPHTISWDGPGSCPIGSGLCLAAPAPEAMDGPGSCPIGSGLCLAAPAPEAMDGPGSCPIGSGLC